MTKIFASILLLLSLSSLHAVETEDYIALSDEVFLSLEEYNDYDKEIPQTKLEINQALLKLSTSWYEQFSLFYDMHYDFPSDVDAKLVSIKSKLSKVTILNTKIVNLLSSDTYPQGEFAFYKIERNKMFTEVIVDIKNFFGLK